jgi:hypothetical protein
MTAPELTAARETLGRLWALGRPLRKAELGRLLRFPGRDPGQSIRDYESGATAIPGAVAVAVEMMLRGAEPPDGVEVIRKAS